jgi:hypothetical protein
LIILNETGEEKDYDLYMDVKRNEVSDAGESFQRSAVKIRIDRGTDDERTD